ncbi:MAG: hypothetical protein ACQEXQ_08370 [Bacillota bacterium]
MLQKIRYMGAQSKYSALSLLSLLAVLFLHLIHWLSAPLLIGAAAEMHMHHQNTAGNSSVVMGLLMIALFVINLISMYFAIRQLLLAWEKRDCSTPHTYLCSAISVGVLGMGIYTSISL